MKIKGLLKAAKIFVLGHGPQIATGVGVALAFAAGVKAVKETPKAVERIEEKKKEENVEELTVVDTVKATWKCYAPAVVMFILSAVLIIGAQRATARKAAAFATAYQLSEQMLQEYKDAAKEIVGEKKAREIQDQAAIQQVQHNPPVANNIIVTGRGKTLCRDALSWHDFYSDPESIRQDFKRAVTDKFATDVCLDFIPVEDWYYQANIRDAYNMTIHDGLGWNRDDGIIEPIITCTMGTDEYADIPIIMVDFSVKPHPDKRDPNHAFA